MPKLTLPPEAPGLAPPPVRRYYPERRHRGAWKVAYADFVTALMALFIVLWMMNASGSVKRSIQGYFNDPREYARRLSGGVGKSIEAQRNDQKKVEDLQGRIEQALRQMPEFQKISKNIILSMTSEGLRIDLLENEQGMFFVTGSPAPSRFGERLIQVLAGELSRMPNSLVIEGHTDARPFRNTTVASGYSNWELAADRANAARRLLHGDGVRPEQVVEMRGFADQRLLNPADPNDPRNRRISVVVKFQNGEK
ncbi:MAG TPA: flagellar motor protein MotB [Bryobacteraceae bacterium]|nr:flagellar motor protein MotB [Bryobacteraceae bacterium]